jgi:tripartite-type tricarboxylate transporter receptor subunit TctC
MANWIAGATKKPGALTKQAKAAHKTVGAFAASVKAHPAKHSSTTLKRANLAQTLGKLRKSK